VTPDEGKLAQLRLNPTDFQFQLQSQLDGNVISSIIEKEQSVDIRMSYGIFQRKHQQGLQWNYKRVRREYLLLGMNKRRKVRRRVPTRVKVALIVPDQAGDTWSMDFMCDVLMNKRRFRTLNIIDDYNREAIALEAAYTMPTMRVTQILELTIHEQGKPSCIRVDNGP
jgi:putative transposase